MSPGVRLRIFLGGRMACSTKWTGVDLFRGPALVGTVVSISFRPQS